MDTKVYKTNKGPYKFLKIVMVWPPSFCNTDAEDIDCDKPLIDDRFTIHGGWTMYTATKWVAPYNKTGCHTTEIPLPAEAITRELLGELVPDMIHLWPDVEFYLNETKTDDFWKYQWVKHGMCFKHPTNPKIYFQTTINIPKTYNFLQILNQGGYNPDNGFYNATKMATTVNDALGVDAELRCNKNTLGNVQLHEIWVRLNRTDVLIPIGRPSTGNCPTDKLIQFPSATLVSD
ncbi:ribonuclease 1-like [Tripterygium wilfordii]|uniref:ribonuclease 1-like n=1 Tax=Tripterygium wilfordii TaxID=458696 RepID=UPI0018F801FE|nr:ribonuclease 1-like [Tripterygium wilfordii]